jgi:hypothetical protein
MVVGNSTPSKLGLFPRKESRNMLLLVSFLEGKKKESRQKETSTRAYPKGIEQERKESSTSEYLK